MLRKAWTCEMHWMFRGAEGCSLQVALHLVERFRDLLCIACAASFQDAQKAAAVWWKELRRPRPPRLRASRARWAVASGKAGRCRSWARLCWMLWLWAAAGSRFETGRSPPKSCFNEGRSGCRQHNSQKKTKHNAQFVLRWGRREQLLDEGRRQNSNLVPQVAMYTGSVASGRYHQVHARHFSILRLVCG